MAGHIAATAAPARRDSRLLSMTSPSTSSATALGCARTVTPVPLALHHLGRSESGLKCSLATSDGERTFLWHAARTDCRDAIGTEAHV